MMGEKKELPLCPKCHTPLKESEGEAGRGENVHYFTNLYCPKCNYEWSGW